MMGKDAIIIQLVSSMTDADGDLIPDFIADIPHCPACGADLDQHQHGSLCGYMWGLVVMFPKWHQAIINRDVEADIAEDALRFIVRLQKMLMAMLTWQEFILGGEDTS